MADTKKNEATLGPITRLASVCSRSSRKSLRSRILSRGAGKGLRESAFSGYHLLMRATIVEFRREQGMGRASVDGVGELPFDASVVGVAWTSLTAGRQVE